jgi:GST-like protein
MATTQTKPIELHFWPTPNGKKITVMLEELGVPYELFFVNIGKGEQFKPEFLAISPNNRIPAIVDPEGPGGKPVSVFESAAIMMYLGRKFGRFYPQEERQRVVVEEWLMWQMGNVGPMFGQANHFRNYAPEKVPYAIARYTNEVHRLYRVLNTRLEGREFVAGEYTIADMALIGWMRDMDRYGIDPAEFPNAKAWIDRLADRPATAKGLAVVAPTPPTDLATDKEAQKILFNQR